MNQYTKIVRNNDFTHSIVLVTEGKENAEILRFTDYNEAFSMAVLIENGELKIPFKADA